MLIDILLAFRYYDNITVTEALSMGRPWNEQYVVHGTGVVVENMISYNIYDCSKELWK